MHPLTAVNLAGGVARWSRLASMGVARGSLVLATREGILVRPARGVYCRPELATSIEVIATSAVGQLTCSTGARELGLDSWGLTRQPHLRTPRNPRPARRDQSGVVVHAWGRSGSGAVARIEAVLHDCAACLPLMDAVVIIDSALRNTLIDPAEWPAVLAAGPHAARVRRALAMADPGAQSVLESVGRMALRLAGVDDVVSQVWFAEVGWVDLVVGGWLVIELDGRETHLSTFQQDRRRDAELTRRGLVVLRFTYADLRFRLDWFVEVVLETLVRGRPPFADLRRGADFDTSA